MRDVRTGAPALAYGKTSTRAWNRPWTWMPSAAIKLIATIDTSTAMTAYSTAACPSSSQNQCLKAFGV